MFTEILVLDAHSLCNITVQKCINFSNIEIFVICEIIVEARVSKFTVLTIHELLTLILVFRLEKNCKNSKSRTSEVKLLEWYF